MSVSRAAAPPSAKLDGVVKEYPGGVQALRDVSVAVTGGEQVAVVGPSGSGKTTLLTILGTLERATDGTVEIAGVDVDGASDRALAGLRAHRIGFVFQSFHLQDSLSALDNVATGMLYCGMALRARREVHEAVEEARRRCVGLEHVPVPIHHEGRIRLLLLQHAV